MREVIRVGMADYKLCQAPQLISTLGLGSCMGVVLYDPKVKICGMAHVMLPDSNQISNSSNRFKFVDTCLHDMYADLLKTGVAKERIVAKIAGGARMFAYDCDNEHLNIGGRNIDATREWLQQKNIPVLAEDVADKFGRTIEFSPETGELKIKAVGVGIYSI